MTDKPSLASLRERFKTEKVNKEKKNNFGDNNMYPFWQMNNGETAKVRLLPDANPNNPDIFSIEKLEHTLSINGKDRKIPCLKMYGEKCPICDVSAAYYKQQGKNSKQGKYYYRKLTTLVRLLILNDPLPPNEAGEKYTNKVCNSQFGYQINELIKAQIADETENGLQSDPWDMDKGYDFIISKTAAGKNEEGKDVSTYLIGTSFARNPSPIPANLRDSIELIDLRTLLPKNPGEEKVQALLSAHLTGEGDPDSEETQTGNTTPVTESSTSTTTSTPVVSKVEPVKNETPAVATATTEDDDGEDNILARIRNRVGAK